MKNLFIVITYLVGTNITFAQDAAEDRSLLEEVTATMPGPVASWLRASL